MRVASYAQRTAATQASLIAVMLLVITILQGTTAILTLVYHFQKSLEPITALLWLLSYFVAAVGLMMTHGLNWVFWLFRYRLLLVILILGVIASIGWSIDPNVSATRVMHLVGSSLIAMYLGFLVPLATILSVLAWVLGFIILASVGAVFALPSLGIESYEGTQVWRGIVTSKNTLGFWAAVAVLLYISQWSRAVTGLGRMTCAAMALLSFATLYFSKSATSLLALIVGGTIALYFFIAHRFQLGFVRMVVLAVLFTALIALAFMNINTAELIGRSGDLTGRGEVWSQTWKLILDRPLTGYGYGSIWNPNDATLWIQEKLTDFTWVVYHAHNGFLQVASEIGLPLSMIALLMVVQQLIEIFYCQYQRQQLGVLFVLGFVTTYLVTNYSEARFLVNRELYWILFLALPISMLRQVTVVLPGEDPEAEGEWDPDPDDPRGYAAATANGAHPAHGVAARQFGQPARARLQHSGTQAHAGTDTPKRVKKSRKYIDQEGDAQDERRRKPGASNERPSHLSTVALDQMFDEDGQDIGAFDADKPSAESSEGSSGELIPRDLAVDVPDDKFDQFSDSDFDVTREDIRQEQELDINLSRKRRRRGDQT